MLKNLNTSQPRIIDLCTKYSMQSIAGMAEELRTEGCAYWMETHRDECPTGTDLGALGYASLEELEFALAHYQDKCFEKPREELAEEQTRMLATYYSRASLTEQYEELANDPQHPRRLHIAAALADYDNPEYEQIRQERMAWIASLNGEYLGRWGIEGFYFPSIVPTWTVAGPEKKEDKRV